MDHVSQRQWIEVLRASQCWRPQSNEQGRSQEVLRARFKRDKTYNNRTEEIQWNWGTTYREWTTGSQAQVSYWDVVQETSVTTAAVRMGVKEMGMRNRAQGAYNQPPSWDQEQVCMHYCRTIRRALACNKIEIDWKKRGLDPQVPGPLAKWLTNWGGTSGVWLHDRQYAGHMILDGFHIPEEWGFVSWFFPMLIPFHWSLHWQHQMLPHWNPL